MRHIAPPYQGEHVGLSGLYALVNAFRLALARHRPLGDEETRLLLAAGIRFIDTHGQLRHILTGGIRLTLWRRLAEALREHMGVRMASQARQPPAYAAAWSAAFAWGYRGSMFSPGRLGPARWIGMWLICPSGRGHSQRPTGDGMSL